MAKFRPSAIEIAEAECEATYGSRFLGRIQGQALAQGMDEVQYLESLESAHLYREMDSAATLEATPEQRAAFDAFSQETTDEIRHKIAECRMLHGDAWKAAFDRWRAGDEESDE